VTKRRRFPPPLTVEEYRGISYVVRDANNFAVAYVYFESEPGRRAAANLMTKDEARKSGRHHVGKRSSCVLDSISCFTVGPAGGDKD
jgi:hypothetical protein